MTWRRHWTSRCRVVLMLAALGITSAILPAQPTDPGPESGDAPRTLPPPVPVATQSSSPSGEHGAVDPYEAMRAGNELLRAGDASAALRRYDDAAKVLPDAREIAFAQGLAHQRLKQFDEAREAFRRAAAGPGDRLTDDALYSSAASDHAEALQKSDDPKASMSLLESAMDGYQAVLAARPDHEPARDANVKAATRWRQIRELLEQQNQQNQSSGGDENKEDGEQDQEKSESQQSEEPSDEQQQSSPSDEQQQSEQQEKQSAEESSESKDQQLESAQEKKEEKSSSDENEKSEESQQEAKEPDSAEEREQVSREQAERKLREMMQGVRDRRKDRRAPVAPVRVAPVDKDW